MNQDERLTGDGGDPPVAVAAAEATDDELVPGTVVTVAGPDWVDEPAGRLYVVIDNFKDPLHTIAQLGGDEGYVWPNVPRAELTPVDVARLVAAPAVEHQDGSTGSTDGRG